MRRTYLIASGRQVRLAGVRRRPTTLPPIIPFSANLTRTSLPQSLIRNDGSPIEPTGSPTESTRLKPTKNADVRIPVRFSCWSAGGTSGDQVILSHRPHPASLMWQRCGFEPYDSISG